jgi:hypothetical protein
MALADTFEKWRSGSANYLNAQVKTQMSALEQRLRASGATLDAVAKQLTSDPNLSLLAPLATQGASRIERFADVFAGREPAQLWHDAEKFARHRPLTATLGATVVGFAISRAVKASAGKQ